MPFPTVNYVEIKSLHQLYEIYDIDCAGSLSKDNYSHPLKPYHLTNTEARCQYLKGKTVCGQQHQFGYVVETKEGEKVIVGHCCALKHLGIDDKEIQNDFSKARRNEDYERRRAKVLKFLSSRDAVADELKNLEKD